MKKICPTCGAELELTAEEQEEQALARKILKTYREQQRSGVKFCLTVVSTVVFAVFAGLGVYNHGSFALLMIGIFGALFSLAIGGYYTNTADANALTNFRREQPPEFVKWIG